MKKAPVVMPSRETFGREGGYAIGMLLKNSHDFFV